MYAFEFPLKKWASEDICESTLWKVLNVSEMSLASQCGMTLYTVHRTLVGLKKHNGIYISAGEGDHDHCEKLLWRER